MTDEPGDPANRDVALAAAARTLTVVVDRLEAILPATDALIPDVRRDWADDAGRMWVERARLVRRALAAELDAALDLSRTLAREVSDSGGQGGWVPPVSPMLRQPERRSGGPRLGGTDADRVDEERGVRIAELPGSGGPAG